MAKRSKTNQQTTSSNSTASLNNGRFDTPPNIPRRRTSRNGAILFALGLFAVGFFACLAITLGVFRTVSVVTLLVGLFVGWCLAGSIHIVMEWERAVILRLGRFNRESGPGIVFTIPFIEFYTVRVDQRVSTTFFSAEETLTADLVPVNVDAVLFWMVFSARKAALEVEDYAAAVNWVAQTSLRKAIGRNTVFEVATRRQEIDDELQLEIEEKLTPWGIAIIGVEVRDIVVPKELQEAMAKESIAERERDARMVLAEAEKDISDMMADAAEAYADNPDAMKLRTMHLAYESVKSSGGTVVLPSSFSEGFVPDAPVQDRARNN